MKQEDFPIHFVKQDEKVMETGQMISFYCPTSGAVMEDVFSRVHLLSTESIQRKLHNSI